MSIKISTKRGGERKTRQQRQEASSNRGLYWSTLVGQQSPELGLAYYGAFTDKVQERIKKRFITARKAIDQRCFESNRLPKNEDIKLKKKRTFWEKHKIYILLITAFVTCFVRVL